MLLLVFRRGDRRTKLSTGETTLRLVGVYPRVKNRRQKRKRRDIHLASRIATKRRTIRVGGRARLGWKIDRYQPIAVFSDASVYDGISNTIEIRGFVDQRGQIRLLNDRIPIKGLRNPSTS